MLPPDVQVTLECIDPLNGKTIWTNQFDRILRPYRCEAYTNGIVAFLSPVKGDARTTEVVFLDPRNGSKVTPFDTRAFVFSKDDSQIARSGGYGSQGSVEEERSEITLPNGWRSKGIAGLSWRNAGSNHVYFLRKAELKWTMTLPDGAYNLAHWNEILIYKRSTEEGKRIISTLCAQPAGKETVIWRFTLPEDIPDRPFQSFDFTSDRTIRFFSYLVGKNYVFAFGGGTLFALDPKTGGLLWRHSVAGDPVVRSHTLSMDSADIVENDGSLLLVSASTMLRFDLNSKTVAAVLREDLHQYGPSPIVANGAIYCFTERD